MSISHLEQDDTLVFSDGSVAESDHSAIQIPSMIGRYRIDRLLGHGGFGTVYLAHDDQLDRLVAVKVPHQELIGSTNSADSYLLEARTVAKLDHPRILQVYDVGSDSTFPCYIVSQYVKGQNLRTQLQRARPSYREAAELICTLADALHSAHQLGFVHRDIKPSNILIGDDGRAYIVDFGLALREENIGTGPEYIGTPSYMSPEQARGEGHRVDWRSDVFSLGVVFYELLTGRKPFVGDTRESLLKQIVTLDPQPMRQLDPEIPLELERVCRKAMSKLASDRYSTANEMADDLHDFLERSQQDRSANFSSRQRTNASSDSSFGLESGSERSLESHVPLDRVIPKGLRAFDSHDSNFFLKLLPGPTDRDGLPESLRFWMTRIESRTPGNTFEIGVIYGPSGCGKSSLVKAGLQPRLSHSIHSVYVEATPNDSERRLINALRSHFPEIDQDLSLSETLSAIRRGAGHPQGTKLVIILDQFEQWLSTNQQLQNAELTKALRHCDGSRIQCLLLVRDDFWLSLSRLLKELEVALMEGHNCLCMDLFTPEHARNVLLAFGQAYGRLPENAEEISTEQRLFLDDAINGLAQSGKLICVRLALFAEMMRNKPWLPSTLQIVGGAEGIGITFLEETFDAKNALPEYRYHQAAARAVLERLLPEPGHDIRGEMKTAQELLEASGYAQRPGDFEDLIRVLDNQLRLITPISPNSVESSPEGTGREAEFGDHRKYYQLTHDYLVHSLRDWLTRTKRETRRGRAELNLAGLASRWSVSPENRYLPTWLEFLEIRLLTDSKLWTKTEKELLLRSGRLYRKRSLQLICGTCLLLGGVFALLSAGRSSQRDHEAKLLVEALIVAETTEVPSILVNLEEYSSWTKDDLQKIFSELPDQSRAKLHVALALVRMDDDVLPFLQQRLLSAPAEHFATIRRLLDLYIDPISSACIELVRNTKLEAATRFRAACVLATSEPDHELWSERQFCEFVSKHMVRKSPAEAVIWKDILRPKRQSLLTALRQEYLDSNETDLAPYIAAEILADYHQDDPAALFDLFAKAQVQQFNVLADALTTHSTLAVKLAEEVLSNLDPISIDPEEHDTQSRRQVNAAILLLKLNRPDSVWPLLQHNPIPTVRAMIVNVASQLDVDPLIFVNQYDQESDESAQQALLLALGGYSPLQIEDETRLAFQEEILKTYRTAADPGLHASVLWILQRWEMKDEAEAIERSLRQNEADLRANLPAGRRWYINSIGQTFVILNANEFRMGSPEYEAGRRPNESAHMTVLNRRFAVASTEVTKSQWRIFENDSSGYVWSADQSRLDTYFPTEDSPFGGMTWFQAAQFCNWLSEREGIDRSQWCYEPLPSGYRSGMRAKENFLQLTGYRLPTEAEWEFACRSGTVTSRFFGESDALLHQYARYLENAEDHTWPVGQLKPNDWGIFDMYGNAYEWCHSAESAYDRTGRPIMDQVDGVEVVTDNPRRILRGGSFTHPAAYLRSADRNMSPPNDQNYRMAFGFRPVRTF